MFDRRERKKEKEMGCNVEQTGNVQRWKLYISFNKEKQVCFLSNETKTI